MDVELSELRLVWPPRLFSDEAQALLDGRNPDSDMEWLLSEAFADDRGTRLLQLTGRLWQDARSAEPWESSTSITLGPGGRFIRALIDDAPDLPRYERPRYWSARQRPATPEPVLTLEGVKEAFVQVVLGLVDHGYFDEAFGSSCCDARSDPEAGQERLAELLDVQVEMWPLSSNGERTHVEQAWDEEALFDVLEA